MTNDDFDDQVIPFSSTISKSSRDAFLALEATFVWMAKKKFVSPLLSCVILLVSLIELLLTGLHLAEAILLGPHDSTNNEISCHICTVNFRSVFCNEDDNTLNASKPVWNSCWVHQQPAWRRSGGGRTRSRTTGEEESSRRKWWHFPSLSKRRLWWGCVTTAKMFRKSVSARGFLKLALSTSESWADKISAWKSQKALRSAKKRHKALNSASKR